MGEHSGRFVRRSLQVLCAVIGLAALSSSSPAQIQKTPHTLKLDEKQGRPKATLADVKMLVGHWQGDFLGAKADELWLPAAGGAMAGMFRLYEGERVMFYEFMLLVEEEGSVSMKLKHFHANLKGWEEKDAMKTFKLVKSTPEGLWFEGLTFEKQADGSLKGYIAFTNKDGGVREESFVYRPAK